MKKLFTLLTMLVVGIGSSWAEDYPVNFDKNQTFTRGDRHINSVTFSFVGAEQTQIVNNVYENTSTKCYQDLTSSKIVKVPTGTSVTPQFNIAGEWQHGFVYIDLNDDGDFTDDGELVSKINEGNPGSNFSLPQFTTPDMHGTHRMRIKTDWSSTDPGGNTGDAPHTISSNNHIIKNGGMIIDVTLVVLPKYTVTYNYRIDGITVATEEFQIPQGYVYPDPPVPSEFSGIAETYYSIGAKPEGTVTAEVTQDITVTQNLPFATSSSFENANWYAFKFDFSGNYSANGRCFMYYKAGETAITLDRGSTGFADNDLFCAVGNILNGFRIYNKAAGQNYILSSSTTMSGETGADTHPIMTDISNGVPSGNNEFWDITNSTNATNGFFLGQHGFPANRINQRGNFAYWTGGAGAGSTFVAIAESDANLPGIEHLYTFQNANYPQQYIANTGNTCTDAEDSRGTVMIEPAETAKQYYISVNGKYLKNTNTSSQISTTTNKAEAIPYTMEIHRDMVHMVFMDATKTWASPYRNYIHCDGSKNLVGWSADAPATQWVCHEVEGVYVVHGTKTLSAISGYKDITSFVVTEGSTLIVDVNDFDLSKVTGKGNIEIASGKTLVVNVAGFDLTRITGSGTVEIDADVTLSGSKSTVATGKLIINEGKTLTIGAGDAETNSIASFTSIDLAGQIKNTNSTLTLNNVTVPEGKNGVIFSYDMGSTADGFLLDGTTTVNGNLFVCNRWNFQMKVNELAGNGTWTINGTTSSDYSAGTSSSEAATINVANASTYTGNVTVNNTNATVNLSGDLVGSCWTKTNGTLNYKGRTDAEPTLNGTTLSGAILDGSKRLKIVGTGVTLENLAGNNQSTSANTYAFYTAGTGTVTLKGTCDFTKKSDNTGATATYIGVSNNESLVIADNANVKVKCLYNSTTLANDANWTIGSGATLEVTSSAYAPTVTNNGILTLGSVLNTNSLILNEGSRINTGSNITNNNNNSAITVSGNATLHQTSASLNLTPTITIASGKTLTYDGTGVANAALSSSLNVSGDGTLNVTNCSFGSDRDLSNIDCTLTPTTGIVFVETSDEFLHNNDLNGVTINNIPDGITKVTLRRADRTYVELDVDNGTATFTDNTQKVSGPACLYDFTFSKETLAERKMEDNNVILNSGSRGSSNGLNYDWSFNSGNSYNEETGLLKAKSTPWRHMTDDNAWPDNYSVAVYANVPDYENGCLMAFGSSANGDAKNYLALIRGASQNEIKLVKGTGMNNLFTEIATMSAENATVAKHLIIFTKNESTFKVYCDGVNVATTTYDQTLGTGFQIGSVHGGITGTGIVRINDTNISQAIRDAVEVQSIRIFDGVLTDGQMSALIEEFPYVSKGGSYSREISADANLGEDNAWVASDETTSHIPTPVVEDASIYNPDVAITTSADATLTVNENATFGKTSFGGSGTLTIAANEGHSLNIGGAVIIYSDVVVKFGAIDMSTSPVTKGADANLTFDFSDFNFNKVYATTTYTLTGVISQDDTHITATGLPSNDGNRSYDFAFDDNHYKLTVTVRPSQTVYLPSGTTEIEDDMSVKLTAEAATNDGVLIQGDELVIGETGTITCSQSSGFCSINIPEDVTMTVSNTGAQKATTITGDGTLNISMTDDEITTALNGTASCTLIDVSSDDQIAVGTLKIRNDEKCPIGDYNYYISQDGTTKDVVLIKHYTRNVTSGRFGSICIENAALVSQMTGIEKVLKVTSVETDRVVMDEVEEITAGVPYIFKSNADAINLTLKGENADEPVDDPEGYLVGNFVVVYVPNSNNDNDYNYYILQSNQFKKVTSETIKSGRNRCYLKVGKEGLSRQATLGIAVDDGGATGIDAINSLMNNDAEIYDLNGRRLNDLRKGINIVNGVKVIVK